MIWYVNVYADKLIPHISRSIAERAADKDILYRIKVTMK